MAGRIVRERPTTCHARQIRVFLTLPPTMIAAGIQTYIYGALERDLKMDTLDLMFRRVDRAPSHLPLAGKLIRAIEPWGELGRDYWDEAAVRWASDPQMDDPYGLLRGMGIQNPKLVVPPRTWERLEVQLRYQLEHQVEQSDRKLFLNVVFPHHRDVMANFTDFANKFRVAHDKTLNPESASSVISYSSWLLDRAGEQEKKWKTLFVAWAIVLIEHAMSRRFHVFCPLCFRRPLPDTATCEIHSQSKGSAQSGAYQHARRIHQYLEQHRADLKQQLRIDEVKAYCSYTSTQIFGDLVLDETATLNGILDALRAAPNIRKHIFSEGLPTSLKTAISTLREALDPLEEQSETWCWKIRYAEILEVSSQFVQRRRRGVSPATDQMIEKAQNVDPRFSSKEAAAHLGIGRTSFYYYKNMRRQTS
jgi:hypothetical protein